MRETFPYTGDIRTMNNSLQKYSSQRVSTNKNVINVRNIRSMLKK